MYAYTVVCTVGIIRNNLVRNDWQCSLRIFFGVLERFSFFPCIIKQCSRFKMGDALLPIHWFPICNRVLFVISFQRTQFKPLVALTVFEQYMPKYWLFTFFAITLFLLNGKIWKISWTYLVKNGNLNIFPASNFFFEFSIFQFLTVKCPKTQIKT